VDDLVTTQRRRLSKTFATHLQHNQPINHVHRADTSYTCTTITTSDDTSSYCQLGLELAPRPSIEDT